MSLGPEIDSVFNVEQLASNYDTPRVKNNAEDLLANIQILNKDVESIVKHPINCNDESFANRPIAHPTELGRNPTIDFLVKDLNINQSLLFKDFSNKEFL